MNVGMARRRARLTRGFAPQVSAAVPQSEEHAIAEIRWFPVREPVSGNRYTVLRVKTRSGLDRMGRVRTGCGAGCKSAGERVDRQTGNALRGDRRVHAFGRRARYGDARHPREGVPRACLPRAGRADAQQSPGVHGFGRGAGISCGGGASAAARVAESGQGLSESGAGHGQAIGRRS